MPKVRSIVTGYWFVLLAGMASISVFLLTVPLTRPSVPVLSVHYLNVGQGDATLVRLPDATTLLIDGGPDGTVIDAMGSHLPWWQRSIDYLIVTHPHRDHYTGFFDVISRYRVGRVLYSGDGGEHEHFRRLLAMASTQRIPVQKVGQGDRIDLPRGITLQFLWPEPDYAGGEDQRSLALLLSWRAIDFLFMGDVPQREELEVLKDNPSLTAEVLKVGHHGSKNSSNPRFLAAVRPAFCIVSSGRDNRYGHPHRRVLRSLAESMCKTLTTAAYGTITLETDGERIFGPLALPH